MSRPRSSLFLSYAYTTAIWVIILAAVIFAAEYYSKRTLQKEGWLPPDGSSLEERPYAYQPNGFAVRVNTPNYTWPAYDAGFKLQPNSLKTDANGFVTGPTPLSEKKDSDVVRIFITGGSAAWGSLQTSKLMDSVSYPEGNYTYNTSIAGCLLAELQKRYPAIKFEVINAAVVGYTFVQTKALYSYKLYAYQPDIVINMDGYNDVGTFANALNNGNPYSVAEKAWQDELNLNAITTGINRPYIFMLLNIRHMQLQKRRHQAKLAQHLPKGYQPSKDKTNVAGEPDEQVYKLMQPALAGTAGKFLYAVNSHLLQLKNDGVYAIFCLQPLLAARGNQKQLSPLELKMRTHFDKVTVADTSKMYAAMPAMKDKLQPEYVAAMEQLGAKRYETGNYCKAFFYQQYLAPAIDSLATIHGHAFVNVNAQMNGMGSDKEFYIDYCHLTPYGNQFVAGLLASEVAKYLAAKGR